MLFAAGNKMYRIAARKWGGLLGVANTESVARLCAAMPIAIPNERPLRYNIRAEPAQATVGAMG